MLINFERHITVYFVTLHDCWFPGFFVADYWLRYEPLLWLSSLYLHEVCDCWTWSDMWISERWHDQMCVCVFICVRVGGVAVCPVSCRRSVIAECPSMTLRAVGQSSVLCWAVCPWCWKWCTDRHVTVTWLMYMAGFPQCRSGIVSSRDTTERPALKISFIPNANVHHFEKPGSYSDKMMADIQEKHITVKCCSYFSAKVFS